MLIPFKNKGFAIVDVDYDNPIHALPWHNNKGYVESSIGGKTIRMHRMLLNFPDNDTDHINHIRNDNRLSNLRSVTKRQNQNNMKIHKTKMLGTHFHKQHQRWISQIRLENKTKHIGLYKTEIEAHIAYIMYRRGLFA